jgi:hypothetical protein
MRLSRKKYTSPDARFGGARKKYKADFPARTCASRQWFLSSQNQTSICCLRPGGRHRRLSLCSQPIPKQFEEGPRSLICIAQSAIGRTWQPARCGIFFFPQAAVKPLRLCDLLKAHSPVLRDPQRVDTRPSCGLRPGSLDWHSLLLFFSINRGQLVALFGCQLRGFYEHALNILVALLRTWCAHHLIGGASFLSTQTAVTNRLLDRSKARLWFS